MRSQAAEEVLQRKFWAQSPPRGSVQGIGAQWRPSRHSWPGPQLVSVQGETQLLPEQSWPDGHWESSRHWGAAGAGAGAKSGAKQSSPDLQSRSSVQLRSPGRVVPIGSGGALGGGRWMRRSLSARGGARTGEMGPPQAARARARRSAKRMGERYQIAGFGRRGGA